MLARRLPTILPSLTREESLEVIKVHSVAGIIRTAPGAIARPFRAPHHTISDAGLIGGGPSPRPGEVSLAHHGVLFLDELPEFRRNVLEALRQPLEDGYVTVARASASVVFPARFMVVAAMNPCPCGYHGDPRRRCSCSADRIDKYRARISGPLFDRFDVQLAVANPTWHELGGSDTGETSAAIQTRVQGARQIQLDRYRNLIGVFANAHLSASQVKRWCPLDAVGARLLGRAAERLGLSARAHGKVLRLARTIADLAGATEIRPADVAEAVQYRGLDRVRAPG